MTDHLATSTLQPERLLEFDGCIVPLPSDKSEKPAMLTRDQTRQLAEIIFTLFKKWYTQ